MELRELAERILFATTLEEKLQEAEPISDDRPGPALPAAPGQPGRPCELNFKAATARTTEFPKLRQLEKLSERGRLLHFFCNHELLATELMALVLLRFPEAPAAFRRGVWQTLREEQRHTRWYLDRLRACGQTFGELPVSGYFWRAVSGMKTPMDFVAGLSLTFEQANLDFARQYGAALATVGDAESARILGAIYQDEIAHVAHGLKWFRRWKNPEQDDWSAYCQHLAFPLSPTRAKGPEFNIEGRQAAGLDATFIAELDVHAHSKGRTPTVFWFNPLTEGFLGRGAGFCPTSAQAGLVKDLENLPQFLSRRDDVVLVTRRPRVAFLSEIQRAGFALPEWVELSATRLPAEHPLRQRKLGGLRPWAWGPDSAALFAPLFDQLPEGARNLEACFNPRLAALYSKAWSAGFLKRLWPSVEESPWLCGREEIGVVADSWPVVSAAVATIRSRGHHRVVVKAAWGLAGQSALRLWEPEILPAQQKWIESVVAGGRTVVVEPWLERVVDFSVQLEMEPGGLRRRGFTGLINDHRGQFQANWVDADHGLRPPIRVLAALKAAGAPGNWVASLYARISVFLEEELRALGFLGPLGVDAFLFRRADGRIGLKPIVEINPRYTMGRLTLELMSRVAPGIPGEFRLLNATHLRKLGRTSFAELGQMWTDRFPPKLTGSPVPRLSDGIVCLNDPTTASACLAVLAVGNAMDVLKPA